jgi:hypothetical protein
VARHLECKNTKSASTKGSASTSPFTCNFLCRTRERHGGRGTWGPHTEYPSIFNLFASHSDFSLNHPPLIARQRCPHPQEGYLGSCPPPSYFLNSRPLPIWLTALWWFTGPYHLTYLSQPRIFVGIDALIYTHLISSLTRLRCRLRSPRRLTIYVLQVQPMLVYL